MKIFRVKRTDPVNWCEDYECIVCAADKMWAEKQQENQVTIFVKQS